MATADHELQHAGRERVQATWPMRRRDRAPRRPSCAVIVRRPLLKNTREPAAGGAGGFRIQAARACFRVRRPGLRRAGRVVGIGFQAQPDDRPVGLRSAAEERGEARGAADHERQHAGRERVQGADVADAPHAERPPRPGDDVVRGHPRRLVDDQHAVGGRRRMLTACRHRPLPRRPPRPAAGPHPAGAARRIRMHCGVRRRRGPRPPRARQSRLSSGR